MPWACLTVSNLQDERYSTDEGTYDWYQDYTSLAPYITPHLKPVGEFEILIPGCGNSSKRTAPSSPHPLIADPPALCPLPLELGSDLYDIGYANITCIDISTVVINIMSDLYAEKEEMECKPPSPHDTPLTPYDPL